MEDRRRWRMSKDRCLVGFSCRCCFCDYCCLMLATIMIVFLAYRASVHFLSFLQSPFFLTLLLSGVNMPIIPTHIHLNIDTHVSLITHEAIPLFLLFVYLQRNAHSFFHYGSLCALFFKFVVGSQLYFFSSEKLV